MKSNFFAIPLIGIINLFSYPVYAQIRDEIVKNFKARSEIDVDSVVIVR